MGVVMWTGYAGPEWAWPKAHSLLFLISSCGATPRKGGSSEQISQVITYAMALSVSHRMGSQIPVSGAAWCGWSSRGRGYPSDLWLRGLRSGGDECAERPCAPHCYDSAQTDHLGSHGTVKGQTAIKTFKQFGNLRKKPYWGNHFWSPGYSIDTA